MYMRQGQNVLDNQGIWEALADDARSLGISYHRVGSAEWLPVASKEPTDEVQLYVDHDACRRGETVVFKTKYFQIRAIPDVKNHESDPWFVIDRPDSVIVIPVSETEQFLIQKQYRPQADRSSWEFPGGVIDLGETPLQAAERE